MVKIEGGNEFAGRLSFKIRNPLIGYSDVMEELDVSFGKLLKSKPNLGLKLLLEAINSSPQIRFDLGTAIGALGDDYVDKTNRQIIEIKERIKALETVKDSALKEIKVKCITELKDNIKNLKEPNK